MPKSVLTLIVGDVLVFLLFVIIGRNNHTLAITDIGAVLWTTGPFWLAWFLVAPWFGLYRGEISRVWQKVLPRLLVAWVIVGGPLSLIFWALFRGRSIPGGIIPIFAVITLSITTLSLLIWRMGYAWWVNRQQTPDNTLSKA